MVQYLQLSRLEKQHSEWKLNFTIWEDQNNNRNGIYRIAVVGYVHDGLEGASIPAEG